MAHITSLHLALIVRTHPAYRSSSVVVLPVAVTMLLRVGLACENRLRSARTLDFHIADFSTNPNAVSLETQRLQYPLIKE